MLAQIRYRIPVVVIRNDEPEVSLYTFSRLNIGGVRRLFDKNIVFNRFIILPNIKSYSKEWLSILLVLPREICKNESIA